MEFSRHSSFEEVSPGEWNALLSQSTSDNPFLRHEYQKTWWVHRGGGEWDDAELVLITARLEGELVGIAPLFRAVNEGRQALLLSGSIEISDYLDVISAREHLAAFLGGLLDFLSGADIRAWSALDWYNIPSSSPTAASMEQQANARGWRCAAEPYRPTPYIPLEAGFEAYLARLEKKQRHEIRRKLRRMQERGSATRWYVTDGGDLAADTDALFALMAEDRDKAAFLTEEMRAQVRATIQAAHEAGWLWLAFLEVEGEKAAASLNFDYAGRLWGYNSGVSRNYLDLSPGWVLLAHILRWASENGRSEFDFMRGGEDYKYRFGALDRQVLRLLVEKS